MLTDLRYAIRSLAKSRGFVVLVVVSLSLSLGLLTTMYAMIDAALYPYVPYNQPDRIYTVAARGGDRRIRSHETLENLSGSGIFEETATFTRTWSTGRAQIRASVTGGFIYLVSPNFFRVLGVSPMLGRVFDAVGTRPEDENGVVLSYETWLAIATSRDNLDSVTVTWDDRSYDVIGVMPRGMALAGDDYQPPAMWMVMTPSALASGRGVGNLTPLVRLKASDTPQGAHRMVAALASRVSNQIGVPFSLTLNTIRPDPLELKDKHFVLAGSAGLILLIACANVANLMHARGMARRKEMALRRAVGASRIALVRQLLSESVILALMGGTLGMFAATWGMDLLVNRMPRDVNFGGQLYLYLNWRIFAFAFLAGGLAVILSGLGPALRASDVNLSDPLKEGAGTTTGRIRGRYSPLVMAQVALSMILLLAAGILIQVVRRVAAFDFGFDPSGLYSVSAGLPSRVASDSIRSGAMVDHTIARLRKLDGVRAATAMTWGTSRNGLVTSDLPADTTTQINMGSYSVVSPGFFGTLGVRIARGRDFEPGDADGPGAVIINQAAAEALWPHVDPVGRMIKLGGISSDRPWLRVIGVFDRGELSFRSDPWLPPRPAVFVTSRAEFRQSPNRTFVVRLSGDTEILALDVAHEVQALLSLPSAPSARAWFGSYEAAITTRRFLAGLFIAFGAFALLLALVGLYAVMAYAVTQRRREFAVRLTLGATTGSLFRIVLHDGFVMVLGGTAIGAFAAMWAGQALGSWLYNVHPADVRSLLAAELVLCAAAFAACLNPARRATTASPVEILRAV